LFGGQSVLVKFEKTTGAYLQHTLWGRTFFSDGLGSTSDGTYIYVVGLNLANATSQGMTDALVIKADRRSGGFPLP
jgi:hypothetical protein